jgi:hypothetical protein
LKEGAERDEEEEPEIRGVLAFPVEWRIEGGGALERQSLSPPIGPSFKYIEE